MRQGVSGQSYDKSRHTRAGVYTRVGTRTGVNAHTLNAKSVDFDGLDLKDFVFEQPRSKSFGC
jgi:hypothetical protein